MRALPLLATTLVVALSASAAASQPVRFSCGGEALAVTFGESAATAVFGGETIEMKLAASASGARYEAAGDPSTVFWNKGDNGTLTLKGKELPLCVPAAGVFTARGNEPGWRVDVAPGAWLVYRGQDGTRLLVSPPPEAAVAGNVRRYEAKAEGQSLSLDVEAKRCADTMTGMPHPETARLTLGERTLTGCAGDPAALFAGAWTIDTFGDLKARPEEKITAEFGADGHLAGKGPCNRFMGPWTLSGEGLKIGPAAATMMACPGDAMEREQAFFALLDKVNRFEIAEDGALVLFTADGATMRAVR